jgi:hypothetical protein
MKIIPLMELKVPICGRSFDSTLFLTSHDMHISSKVRFSFCQEFLSSLIRVTFFMHLFRLDFIILVSFSGEECKLWGYSLHNFPQSPLRLVSLHCHSNFGPCRYSY